MAKVLVLGAGLMGPAIAGDLLRFGLADHVTLTDFDSARLAEGLRRAAAGAARPGATGAAHPGATPPAPPALEGAALAPTAPEGATPAGRATPAGLEGKTLDLWDRKALLAEMRRADVVAGAYPVAMVREVTEAAVDAGVSLCDLTGSAEGFDVFDFDAAARRRGMAILPGCGLAPGLTNILAGQGAARFDRPLTGVLYVGGLPVRPRPPLEYRVVFSLDTVIDEYVAPVGVVRDGRMTIVPALDGLEELTFIEPVGRCEAFFTYGLGTLAKTGVELGYRELAEKTVRYPGHRDKVALLRDCGFFSQKPVVVDGATVVPRRLAAKVLGPVLEQGDEADVTVLRVVVEGDKGGKKSRWVFELVDFYDEAARVTSMARTTGYTCSIIVGMLLGGGLGGLAGVAPLEKVFAETEPYEALRAEMARRGMVLTERKA